MVKVKRIVDLSISIFSGMSRPAVIRDFEVSHVARVEKDGFDVSEISMSSHAGTHFDAPMHFVKEGIPVDQVSLETVVGEAVILNLTGIGPQHEITAMDLERFTKKIKPKDIVLLYTGSDKWLDKPEYITKYPYLGAAASRWLVEMKVSTVGIDFLAVDALYKEPLSVDAHVTLLGAGIGIVECLTNLGEVRTERPFFVAAPLKIRDGDASPVRAFAIEFE
jgi:kynurenine formamidase